MLKALLAFGLVCSLSAAEPSAVSRANPSRSVQPPATPPPSPPPPPKPTATDCWRDFFINIGACQHDFEGSDRIVVAQRRAALSGASSAFHSCLSQVPAASAPTITPDAPVGARAWTCLEQLVLDIKECRTKFSPGVPVLSGDPERDTMKNAFDQCLSGAVGKNGWCNGRRPNNPVAEARVDILEGPVMEPARRSVTLTVSHTGTAPVSIYWYAAVFNGEGEVVSQQALGMTPDMPGAPTRITLPLTDVGEDGTDIVVLARTTTDGDPLRAGGASHMLVQ